MDTQTLQRLEAAGFVATSVAESLGLSPAEEALMETKVRLTALLKQTRRKGNWTQGQLAKALETTQQVVARAERSGGVSLDFLLRALVALGLSLGDIGAELGAIHVRLQSATAPCTPNEAAAPVPESLISGEEVAAAARPSAPMLRLIRGGFSGHSVKSADGWRVSEGAPSEKWPRAATG